MRGLVSVAALLLAGCAGGVPVERQVVVPGGGFSAVQGEAAFLVRSFLDDGSGERQEVLGAECDVVSSLYRTRLVTPSRLVVPNFGPQSPELAIDCRAGELAGSARVGIVTRWQQAPGYWGPGPGFWGPPYWRNDPWGWGGPAVPISDYPNVGVILR